MGNHAALARLVLLDHFADQLVYGSLTTSIAVLLSVEIGAIVLLLGAQVIAEYERIGYEPINTKPNSMESERA